MEYTTREDCERKHNEVLGAINTLSNRIYKDNGHKSIQTVLHEHKSQIDRNHDIVKAGIWLLSVQAAAVVGALVKLIFFGG